MSWRRGRELADKDKSVKFFVELGENVTDNLIGDVDKIRNILVRLLDNAIRYTKQGSITLSVDSYGYTDHAHQDMLNIVFTIADTGIGIQEERLDNIFDLYESGDSMKNSTHPGHGVGLAISKEDAGKLWLPEVSALLVDDDEVSIEVSRKVLTSFDMKLDVATSGLSAIDMVLNHEYDVVFMDLSMPIMNGIDAMKEIRELDDIRYAMLPIIALDPDAIEGNRGSHISAGFTDSMVKPIEPRRVAA